MDGILNITYFLELRAIGMNVAKAGFRGEQRMRPMLMTTMGARADIPEKNASACRRPEQMKRGSAWKARMF
jgi:hypothetical protein